MLNNESLVETVAELMDDADAVLNLAGISIDESVEDPQEFIETLVDILEKNEFDADTEEMLRLGASLIESFMQELNEDAETTDEGSWSPEQRQAMRHQKTFGGKAMHKADRKRKIDAMKAAVSDFKSARLAALRKSGAKKEAERILAKTRPQTPLKGPLKTPYMQGPKSLLGVKKIFKGPNPVKLAAIKAADAAKAAKKAEKKAKLLKYYDLKDKVSPIGSSDDAAQKKAAGESVDGAEELLIQVVEAVEAAGYEIPEDVSVEDFLEAAEALALTDGMVARALGKAVVKMAGSKTAERAARQLVRAGTKRLVRKLNAPAPVPAPVKLSNVSPSNTAEDLDTLVATMVEMLTSNGYEFEGDAEHFDSESFVEAASEIAETDEDLDEGVSAWLKDASASVKAKMAEALPVGSIKSGFHRVSSKRQGDLKKGLSRKDRYAGKLAVKNSPEDVPKHRLKSGYSD